MQNKKSQAAIEFIVLVGVALFFFASFFLAIQESSAEKTREAQNNLIKDTAFAIQDEINLAAKSSEGYSREFKIPEKLGNQDYAVSIIEEKVYVRDSKNAIALPIPSITGNIAKGNNIIKKENGIVKLN